MAQWAHLPVFSALDGAELTMLFDVRKEVGTAVCEKWNIPQYTNKLECLLSADIDAVCVLTPMQCHKSQVISALEAGKHVFTEKPLAMSSASAKEILAVAHKNDKLVTVGYMKQHETNMGKALEIAKQNEFGKILFVRTHSFVGSYWHACVDKLTKVITSQEPLPEININDFDYGPDFIDADRDMGFYSFDNPFYGLLDTGCHSINLLRFVTQKDYGLLSVNSRAGTKIMNFDFGDFLGTSEFCVNFNMHKWDEVTEVYYEKGTLKIKTPPPLAMQAGAKAEAYFEDGISHQNIVLENNHEWAFMRQAETFVEAVKNNNLTMRYIEESIKDIEMIEDIYKKEQGE
jgi:predicted dehydrogenase